MEMQAANVREVATWLRIEIEGLRNAYWDQIDKTDNDSMSAAIHVAKRLNEAVAEVDATLHSVDLAVDLIEDELKRKGLPPAQIDDVDEDIDDELEILDGELPISAHEGESIAAYDAGSSELSDEIERPYKPRVVRYTQKRSRDGQSTLPEGEWLSLDQDFSYSKPTAFKIGDYDWDALHSWKGTYMRTLRKLAQDFPDAFAALPSSRLIRHRRALFATHGEAMKSPQRIGSLYVETNLSASNISKLLAAFQKHFDLHGEAQVMIRHVIRATE